MADTGTGVGLIVVAVILLIPAVTGRSTPSDTVALSSPLETGRYLIISGGRNATINSHLKTRRSISSMAGESSPPCSGMVELTEDSVADTPVPRMDRQHMLDNHVILDCDGSIVVLAHLLPGSFTVDPGIHVNAGDTLGRVGNTGNTAEPHLHVHVQRTLPNDHPIASEPVWFTINERFWHATIICSFIRTLQIASAGIVDC